MSFNNILINKNDALAQITINRPKKLNALNKETITELSTAFTDLENDQAVRVIILTGSGEKAFVAGADISEFANFSIEEGGVLARKGQEMLFDLVENLSKLCKCRKERARIGIEIFKETDKDLAVVKPFSIHLKVFPIETL